MVDHGSDGEQVTAVANEGYHFAGWNDGSMLNPRADSNVTGDITVTANFAINTYTLTYLADAYGSITGTAVQSVDHGSDGTKVTAVTNEGYHFMQWSDGVTTASRTDKNLTANLTVTAQFARTTYNLTIHIIGKGQVTVNGQIYTEPVTAPADASLIIKATADEGSFRSWKGQLSSENQEETIIMDKDKILLALFSAHVPLSDIKIFPNPFRSQLSLNATGISSVTLTDITGNQVFRTEPFGDKEIKIHTTDLAPGIYFISIETKSGEKLISKVVKSH
jgi:uncharacterized repeat protein (TIGR02543 family)